MAAPTRSAAPSTGAASVLAWRYLFGPVPSRRFGRSLGIDLLTPKTCSFSCVFCQLGRTACPTPERRADVSVAAVLDEFDRWLASGGQADTVTLAGSGEPTLHRGFGDVLDGVAARCAMRRTLLTNSSLMHLEEVRMAAAKADVVKVSLSAWDQASFAAVCRPHPSIAFDGMVEGLRRFRAIFRGSLWVEVFLVGGLNDAPADVARIAALAAGIRPDRIHLNTAVRPPAEAAAAAVPAARLAELARLFDPAAEVVAEFARGAPAAEGCVEAGAILALIRRHPCTAAEAAAALGAAAAEVERVLGELALAGAVRAEWHDGRLQYAAV